MKKEIPFDEKVYKSQMLIVFESIYDKHLHDNKINFYYGLLFVLVALVSFFQLNPDSNLPIIAIVLGLVFLGYSFQYYRNYKTKKKEYIEQIDNEIEENISANQNSVLEFNEEYIRWKNFKIDIKIALYGIKYFVEKENNILIGLAKNTPAIIISKEEIGEENYIALLDIINKNNLISQNI